MSLDVDIERLLPHRGCMLLLDRVIEVRQDSITAEATVAPGAWYSGQDGSMPAWIGVELMAQTVAAYVGHESRRRGEPVKMGFLLGTRAYRSAKPAFPPGQVLTIEAVLSYREENGLGAFDCRIQEGSRLLAEATIKVFEPDDPRRFAGEPV